ncbi:hypothetical protein HaLaN_07065 [Haematococcus lacustris]|uniref:Uncharacterized protein n=1 Tax=Haematococcus lacustris TaxID=44745 RepID=A0A699YPQ6_HAELA|nr:hypothetical protein HaLaN_07065 [Haematococcus lacustris]
MYLSITLASLLLAIVQCWHCGQLLLLGGGGAHRLPRLQTPGRPAEQHISSLPSTPSRRKVLLSWQLSVWLALSLAASCRCCWPSSSCLAALPMPLHLGLLLGGPAAEGCSGHWHAEPGPWSTPGCPDFASHTPEAALTAWVKPGSMPTPI